MTWTELSSPEKARKLAEVYTTGDSAATIAAKVSTAIGHTVTRNAVIGLYHRNKDILKKCPLGGSRPKLGRKPAKKRVRRDLSDQPRNGRRKPATARQRPPQSQETPVMEEPRPETTIRLLDLKPGMCKYPFGSTGDYSFCGHDMAEGDEAYCSFHARRCRIGFRVRPND